MDSASLGLGTILLLALLPAAGNLIGLALAEWREPPSWLAGGAMHAAAGVATAVAAMELAPRAMERIEMWLVALALLCGSIASIGLSRLARLLRDRLAQGEGRATSWGAYAAVGIDLLSDGLMVGAGATISTGLGVLLALSQIFGNLPGAFAVAASFRSAGVSRMNRIGAVAVYPLLPVLGALAGYLVLQGAGDVLTGIVLAGFAGLLLTATIEEIVPEADAPGAPRHISSPFFAGGFVLMLLISAYVGD